MRPLIIALLLAVASCRCSHCDAQGRPSFGPSASSRVFNPNLKVDGHNDANGRSMYNAGRMAELPSGPNKLHCWIVLSDNWQSNPLEFAIAQAVTNDPRMRQIKAGTYFNYYTVSSPKFSQSGLVGAVGTATPIVVLTTNDGMIRGDGTGGLFVNAKSCPQTADEIVDMLCDAIAQINPPPVVDGQTTATQIIRESSGAAPCPDCTPNLPPATQPVMQPTLTPIKPRKPFEYLAIGIGVLVLSGLFACGVIFTVHRFTRVKP